MTDDLRSSALRATMEPRRAPTPLESRDLPTIAHPFFGRVWAPRRTDELSSLLGLLGWVLRGGHARGGWRGQADIDWYLDSTAVRRIGVPRPEDDLVGAPEGYLDDRVREYERDLLARARMAGHGRRDGRALHDLELLAVLRHHGGATRLMDFTRNVWVALWFACREAPDRFGLLVGLDLAGAFAVLSEETLARPYEALLDEAGDRLSLWRPSALSPRISAQQGFFLWGPAKFRAWGSLGEPSTVSPDQPALFEQEPAAGRAVPGLLCIAIPPELKHDLRLHWSSLLGYEQETMFPDLDGFAVANGASAPFEAFEEEEDEEDGDDTFGECDAEEAT